VVCAVAAVVRFRWCAGGAAAMFAVRAVKSGKAVASKKLYLEAPFLLEVLRLPASNQGTMGPSW
jgi:hypothetical protein